MIDAALIIPAFVAGVLTFLAPCTLPMVPGYLGFISGTSIKDLKDPARAGGAKRKIFFSGLLFIIGFSIVFILLGTIAGFLGSALSPFRLWASRIGGVFVILFGLFMLNVIKIPVLQAERHLAVGGIFTRGKPVNSLILGSAFGLGWTPCVGPILGSILLLAATTTTAFQGAVLLTVFSAGLAVPFLAIALGIGSAARAIEKLSGLLNVVSVVGGIFLIFLGVLLLTNNMGLLISYGYRIFQFINYDRLLDFL
ncbi:sulfite exporter TauE/SafE family protein [Candidatus Azambacteria bacterium]|nr:sulfite exporter TauE/SafE family protein [Candidatus Azambacteria bacterium]